jgi:hypothetical protein
VAKRFEWNGCISDTAVCVRCLVEMRREGQRQSYVAAHFLFGGRVAGMEIHLHHCGGALTKVDDLKVKEREKVRQRPAADP